MHLLWIMNLMITQIRLQTRLHVRVPLREPLEHLLKQLVLLPKPRGQLAHVGVRGLGLEPYFGIGSVVHWC
jgi:hypothetical protein